MHPREVLAGVGLAMARHEVGTRSCDPRADRAHRNTADLRGFGVRETEDLGERECFGSVRFEHPDELDQGVCLFGAGFGVPTLNGAVGLDEAPVPLPTADDIGARVPGDREQPRSAICLDPVPRQGAPGADERVLNGVVDLFTVDQRADEPPHWLVGRLDRGCERPPVTVSCFEQQVGQFIHRSVTVARRTSGTVTGPVDGDR
jgi:hypothetical protein